MTSNPLRQLENFGQSIWLDHLKRSLITSGQLRQLIENDGLSGITSNPAIFKEAIVNSEDYDEDIAALAQANKSATDIYEALTVADIQQAADSLRPTYEQQAGRDGFVSLEVSPHLARDTTGTVAEARQLWHRVDRPNIFIKVPATPEGLPAIRTLIRDGINVNITLLFGLARYRSVAEAYLTGLEERLANGQPLERVASVASFFLSRIDVLVDDLLKKKIQNNEDSAQMAKKLHGQVAIASAKVAYQIFKEIYGSERFRKLAAAGGRPQRLLWASTSTKNPDYSDVKYVEALIGSQTVNTLPLKTLKAYRDHGQPELRLETGLDEAQAVLAQLPAAGIDLDAVTGQLEAEGIDKFNRPFDELLANIEQRRVETLAELALG